MENDQEEIQTGEETQEEGSPEPEEQEQEQETATQDEEEIVVSIDDGKKEPEEQQSETEWLKDLRKSWKSYKKENRQLKQELDRIKQEQQPQAKTFDPGPKPTLEACDYDTDAYDKKLDTWYGNKQRFEEEKKRQIEAQSQIDRAWQEQLNRYQERKSKLPVKDYDEVEMIVEDILNPTQQGIIVQGSKNPELVVYALGKNPKRAAEIAAIQNPVNFAFAIAELESQLKTSKRKVSTQPEKTIKGTGRISGVTDNNLERMRREAEKTGDYSKIAAYNRKKRRANAAA